MQEHNHFSVRVYTLHAFLLQYDSSLAAMDATEEMKYISLERVLVLRLVWGLAKGKRSIIVGATSAHRQGDLLD